MVLEAGDSHEHCASMTLGREGLHIVSSEVEGRRQGSLARIQEVLGPHNPLMPALGRERQADLCEFQASYTVGSGTARAI